MDRRDYTLKAQLKIVFYSLRVICYRMHRIAIITIQTALTHLSVIYKLIVIRNSKTLPRKFERLLLVYL